MKSQRFGLVIGMLLFSVLALLPAGCGEQKKEDPLGNQGGNQNGKSADPLAEAKKRSKANLKEIGLAMHVYHDEYRFFPVGLLDPKTGKLGLSWRVAILKYLADPSAKALFNKFKQDEPWDSEHNKKLLAEMPKVYAPVNGQAPAGQTFYQGFAAHLVQASRQELPENANITPMASPFIFPDPRTKFPVYGQPTASAGLPAPGKSLNQIPDGLSNTMLVVEAGEAVPWTKPQDIPFPLVINNPMPDPRQLPKLGGMFGGDFHVLMADGSVNYARKNPPPEQLLGFITPAGGEVVNWDAISAK